MRLQLLPPLVAGAATVLLAATVAGSATQPVPAPTQPGAWKQVGAAVTSRAGKAIHFYRMPLDPPTLGIVVTSTSPLPIRLTWSSYCEFQSDDDITLDDQGTATGTRLVIAYPHSFPAATLCYVWVNAGAPGTATVSAAVFVTGPAP